MRSLAFVVPGDLDTPTGGYGYDRRVISGLRERGWSVQVHTLDDSFPHPTTSARTAARRVFADIPDESVVMVDGLAYGALPLEADSERTRLKLVALVHHPLARETGLNMATASALEASERHALGAARLVVVTSHATGRSLKPYGVSADRVAVVEPGTDRAPLARGSQSGAVQLLCIASIVPRKGHETLVDALAMLRDEPWRLTCVGSLERDPQTAGKLRRKLHDAGLADRVVLAGELTDPDDLSREYDSADVFVLPTFHEGYGMVIAEALARGLPIVSTPTGAILELVSTEAGILVTPGDAGQLAAALRRMIADARVRAAFAAGARRVRDRLPTWEEAATRMEAAIERAGGRRSPGAQSSQGSHG